MLIKLLLGRHAGEVCDISNEVALDLINIGRATRAFNEQADRGPRLAAAAQPAIAIEPAAGRTKASRSAAKKGGTR
jgi:hypothetical protein